jgi:aspartyl-tRNA(Asn)/glutamyl-tRNA(Gln) amidotransferase subunit B
LPPLIVTAEWLAQIKQTLPELPEPRRERLQQDYGLNMEESLILTQSYEMANYYEAVAAAANNPKAAANWVLSELLRELKNANREIQDCPVKPQDLGQLIKLIGNNTISGKMAKEIFEKMFQTGKAPETLIAEQGLSQLTDPSEIKAIIEQALTNNPTQLAQYLAGKQALFGFFVGQVMKLTAGKANPQLVNEILQASLTERGKA